MNEVTDWFPGKIKPARGGMYQIKLYLPDSVGFAYFRRGVWGPVCRSKDVALELSIYVGPNQSLTWRGLKK